jgi:hypothetical protein
MVAHEMRVWSHNEILGRGHFLPAFLGVRDTHRKQNTYNT